MKKVIGAVLAGTMVAGLAFADPKITFQYRLRSNMYDQTQTYRGDGSSSTNKTTDLFALNGYGGNGDTMVATVSNDYAGFSIDYDATTGGVKKGSSTSDTSFTMDALYAWLNFGALKFTAGSFDARYTDKLTNGATNVNLTDKESYKLGVWTGLQSGTSNVATLIYGSKVLYGYDADNMGAISSDNTGITSFSADYTVKDVLPGKLMMKAVLNSNQFSVDTSDGTDKKYQDSGYGFEVGYLTPNVADLDFVLRMPEQKVTVFGAYGTLLVVKNLKAVLGFTYVNDSYDGSGDVTSDMHNGTSTKNTEYAFDARAQYAFSDKLTGIAHFNYSSIKPDGEDAETGMYIVGDVYYVVNDLITPEFSAGYYMTDLDDNDSADVCENYYVINPSVKFTAGPNAFLSVGVRYQGAANTGDAKTTTQTKSEISIPTVFRVTL